ncbi:hypothetical protein HID58_007885 [Brassica napus]|uniref:Uncharacterized protein n=1 Tax=Brassica napus TaxID=3708 RepID=A0ABQ7XK53_BRANA|nr:hypothetical protein HID58_007885 [Brassica napus]
MIGVSSPAEEGDDNAAAAALSSEDFYSPNKSVRVAELDLALDLSIGRNHSKVHSKESLKGSLAREPTLCQKRIHHHQSIPVSFHLGRG